MNQIKSNQILGIARGSTKQPGGSRPECPDNQNKSPKPMKYSYLQLKFRLHNTLDNPKLAIYLFR